MSRRPRSRTEHLASQDRWLLSYADFMTLLFALFVVLFAASRQGSPAMQRVARAIHSGFSEPSAAMRPAPASALSSPEARNLAEAEQQLRAIFGPSLRRGDIGMEHTREGLVISLREIGFFDSGEAGLLPGAAAKIESIGAVLRQHRFVLRVEGHSDDQPIHTEAFQSNWELSAARAMTVLLLLVDDAHYDPTRISMAGYGPYRPVADNRTAEGRRLNRRVDLVVLPGP